MIFGQGVDRRISGRGSTEKRPKNSAISVLSLFQWGTTTEKKTEK